MRTKKLTSLLLVIMIVGPLGLVSCISGGNSLGSLEEGETVVASVLQA